MKTAVCFVLLMSIMVACKKAEELTFDHSANIHFNLGGSDLDSIVYTFAYTPTLASDTIWIPVQLSGIKEDQDRTFNVYAEQDSSTAKPGLDYEALQPSYTLKANTGDAYIPVIIYNVSRLSNESVSLIIKLKESRDLGTQVLTDQDGKNLLRAKIVYSAMLTQPSWWNMWLGSYYSRTKHELFLIVTGVTTLTTSGLDAPRNLYIVNLLTTMLNDPFKWVAKNPAKGYVLKEVTAGDNTQYYFYNTDVPDKKILLKKDVTTGKYYFIDENGDQVI